MSMQGELLPCRSDRSRLLCRAMHARDGIRFVLDEKFEPLSVSWSSCLNTFEPGLNARQISIDKNGKAASKFSPKIVETKLTG